MVNLQERTTSNRCWNYWAQEEAQGALASRYAMRRKAIDLTIQVKIHNPSNWKRRELLGCSEYITNLKAKVLKAWKETPDKPRKDGPIATVFEVQAKGFPDPSRDIADILKKAFAPFNNKENLELPIFEEGYYTSDLYFGVLRECAVNILNWVNKLKGKIKMLPEYKELEINWELFFLGWAKLLARHKQTGAIIIPFGRNKGQTLAKHGRREARWILKRLLSEEELVKTLECIDALLSGDPMRIQEASFVDHPWKQHTRHQRALRERRLLQRVLEPKGELVILGTLREADLQKLRVELLEQRDLTVKYTLELRRFQSALTEAQQHTMALEHLRQAIEIYLYEKPDDFPSIEQVQLSEQMQQTRQHTYESWLRWFALEEGDSVEKFTSEERESWARAGLLQAAHALEPPNLQPIPLIKTMRPGKYHGFALLFDNRTYEYVLAISIYRPPKKGMRSPSSKQSTTNTAEPATITDPTTGRTYKIPGVGDHLYFVNFPETQFKPQRDVVLMLFPLECGSKYQDALIRNAIQRQRALQYKVFEDRKAGKAPPRTKKQLAIMAEKARKQATEEERPAKRKRKPRAKKELTVGQCLPTHIKQPFGSARIVCRWTADRKPEFYVHLGTRLPLPEKEVIPEAILGLHEHDDGYSYAIVSEQGDVKEVGDLPIPVNVDPVLRRKPNTDNYVFETALSVIKTARSSKSYLAVEDTSYKKGTITHSREANRKVFRRPSQRILKTIEDKAIAHGLQKPWEVWGVHPAHDCGSCGARLAKGTKCLRRVPTTTCPQCQTRQFLPWDKELKQHRCTTCATSIDLQHVDIIAEQLFICTHCNAPPTLARHNTALVVARRGIEQLIRYHNPRSKKQSKPEHRSRGKEQTTLFLTIE